MDVFQLFPQKRAATEVTLVALATADGEPMTRLGSTRNCSLPPSQPFVAAKGQSLPTHLLSPRLNEATARKQWSGSVTGRENNWTVGAPNQLL